MSKFENLCNEYRENKRMIEQLTEMNDALKIEIIKIMNGRETVMEGATKATYKPVNGTKFETADFKKAYPKLYAEYTKENNYFRFTVQ